jgi:hypothetical protein
MVVQVELVVAGEAVKALWTTRSLVLQTLAVAVAVADIRAKGLAHMVAAPVDQG